MMSRLKLALLILFAGLKVCASIPLNDDGSESTTEAEKLTWEGLYAIHDNLVHEAKQLNEQLNELEKIIANLTKISTAQEALIVEYQISDWTTIENRMDGSVDFNRSWQEYKNGFGNPPAGEFFVGLQKLHELSTEKPYELLIVLKHWEDDETRYAHYDHFEIGSEQEKYALKNLGQYSGNAGDSLTTLKDAKFSTSDADNEEKNCAQYYKAAWWFKTSCVAGLHGPYRTEYEADYMDGISWLKWTGEDYSLKSVQIKIRPKRN
ncbi:fibrinogen C domain-containing protein 1 [Stomoxys calcitrans]|uniref:fibrinogen C domain-containing protein 1 n=1 Tax=Stomoxys calcitrans TaxID=35570 RepID=UPI0027E2EB20|nr:fibrinogen C domain-containing protein 1 [Stomoxys calcitrans]